MSIEEVDKIAEIITLDFTQPIPLRYFSLKKEQYRLKHLPHAPKRNPLLT